MRTSTTPQNNETIASLFPLFDEESEKLVGTLLDVQIYNGGWGRGTVQTDDLLSIIVIGNPLAGLEADRRYEFTGKVVHHATYGRQFQVMGACLDIPLHRESLIKHLRKTFTGVGEVTARKLVELHELEGSLEMLRDALVRDLRDRIGFVRLSERIRVLMNEADRRDKPVAVPDDLVDTLAEKLGKDADDTLPYFWVSALGDRKRLARMGITTPEQLRMACREFLQFREFGKGIDRAVQLERALIGTKVGFDFFPTPKDLCARMVEMSGLQSGDPILVPAPRYLEPEAGNGNIAEAIRAAGVEPDVVELSAALREILEAKKFNVIGWNFMDVSGEWDCIIMNPPFGRNIDIEHVRHAYSLLAERGRIVAIIGSGAFHRSGKTEEDFRNWLTQLGAEVEELPNGTFNDRTLMATTGANARLVRITKASFN